MDPIKSMNSDQNPVWGPAYKYRLWWKKLFSPTNGGWNGYISSLTGSQQQIYLSFALYKGRSSVQSHLYGRVPCFISNAAIKVETRGRCPLAQLVECDTLEPELVTSSPMLAQRWLKNKIFKKQEDKQKQSGNSGCSGFGRDPRGSPGTRCPLEFLLSLYFWCLCVSYDCAI